MFYQQVIEERYINDDHIGATHLEEKSAKQEKLI
jgi:hypothetical protein